MRIKKAFTLAETTVVLIVIGILATITISTLTGSLPDKKKAMFKKAYSVTERVVGEMVNDETLYPYDRNRIGFKNTDEIEIPGTGVRVSGAEKFCRIFSDKLNTVGAVAVNGNFCTFETTDSIRWQVPVSDFQATNPIVIRVDINGGNEPNFNNVTYPNGDNEDILRINVRADGKINVNDDGAEAQILRSQSIKKDNN